IDIRLQYQNHCLDADEIARWNQRASEYRFVFGCSYLWHLRIDHLFLLAREGRHLHPGRSSPALAHTSPARKEKKAREDGGGTARRGREDGGGATRRRREDGGGAAHRTGGRRGRAPVARKRRRGARR